MLFLKLGFCISLAAFAQEVLASLRGLTMLHEFPNLTGPFPVGMTKRHIIDTSRKESHNPTTQRELMISFWYPAEQKPFIKYLRPYCEKDCAAELLLKKFSYPSEDYAQLSNIYIHSGVNIAPARTSGPFPVVVFSHGYIGSSPSLYTAFLEELASQGFIVVAIAHSYYASLVTFPDGRQIAADPEKYTQMKTRLFNPEDVKMWVDDVQFVLDTLHEMNADPADQFYGILDMEHIGMFGHSFGGATAFQCMKDARLKAGISLDGALFLEDTDLTHLTKPFLFILAQGSIDAFKTSDEELARQYGVDVAVMRESRKQFGKIYPTTSSPFILSHVIIPNLNHGGFSDFLLLKDLPLCKKNKDIFNLEAVVGSAGAHELSVINKHIADFFSKHLKA